MKKILIIVLFLLSSSVLAHSTMHNDFESMMKRMFKQMQMMDMHHENLFKGMGKRHNKQRLFMNQSEDENTITLNITLKEIDKEDLDIHIEKNFLIIKAEKEISSESSHSKRSFVQKILIPKNADRAGITAQFDDNILVVTIPKNTETEPEVQKIIIQ